MLGHEFQDVPGRSTAVGENPHETVMLLRCKWCTKAPTKAREDGCPIHELEETGKILLSVFNPAGVTYFHGRTCLGCGGPIMDHWLRKGQGELYWCQEEGNLVCAGISDCVWDVEGIAVPQENLDGGDNDVSVV